ncbi:hypothetical protein BDW42DRAFT_88722 [Aspergillus taichungensis]|uniref:Uncharacterized protein n=1 Tax=Aspergillus taichungensis TaxID=482145 RepID=A0A2J5HXB2_9EURO|nr:hypothetical protein BDW42DRAFT_88722 [Aspergillus taichungensis]
MNRKATWQIQPAPHLHNIVNDVGLVKPVAALLPQISHRRALVQRTRPSQAHPITPRQRTLGPPTIPMAPSTRLSASSPTCIRVSVLLVRHHPIPRPA